MSPGNHITSDSEAVCKMEAEIDELKEQVEELKSRRLEVIEDDHFNHEI